MDFQSDVLEAHRRGMRCVFLKEGRGRQNDVISSATPPAEGTQKTYTAMGSETYLQDSLLEDFADGVVCSWSEVPDVVAEWTSSATEDLSPSVFAEQLVKAAGGGEFWPRFVEEGIQDVATLKLLTEEDRRGAGLPLGCRRRLLPPLLTNQFVVIMARPSPALLARRVAFHGQERRRRWMVAPADAERALFHFPTPTEAGALSLKTSRPNFRPSASVQALGPSSEESLARSSRGSRSDVEKLEFCCVRGSASPEKHSVW